MNRTSLSLLVVCLGLGTWAVWERQQRLTLTESLATATRETRAAKERLEVETKKLTTEVAVLKKKAAAAAAETKPETPAGEKAPANSTAEAAAGMAKMFSDPKMRDMMKAQARMGIDMLYRDLFELLNLPEPQRTQFEKLMNEKATAGMDAAFSMMGQDKTPEERKAAAEEIRKMMADSDAKIKALLSKEDYETVKRYEESTGERMQLKTFNSMLASKELNIDEGTEAKLMDVMYEERTKFPFASNFVDQQNPDITRFTPENIQKFADEYGQLSGNITNRATTILTPEQLEVFRQSQEQNANMVKMQMEMAAKMFSPAPPK